MFEIVCKIRRVSLLNCTQACPASPTITDLVTEALLLQDLVCGTVYR